MPTVPNLPAAALPLDGTELLWLTKGLGLTRDQKLALSDLKDFIAADLYQYPRMAMYNADGTTLELLAVSALSSGGPNIAAKGSGGNAQLFVSQDSPNRFQLNVLGIFGTAATATSVGVTYRLGWNGAAYPVLDALHATVMTFPTDYASTIGLQYQGVTAAPKSIPMAATAQSSLGGWAKSLVLSSPATILGQNWSAQKPDITLHASIIGI
jgi:hypothetical protein